jgi:hypothetical protein
MDRTFSLAADLGSGVVSALAATAEVALAAGTEVVLEEVEEVVWVEAASAGATGASIDNGRPTRLVHAMFFGFLVAGEIRVGPAQITREQDKFSSIYFIGADSGGRGVAASNCFPVLAQAQAAEARR